MKLVTLIGAAAVVGIALGGVAVAGMQALDEQSAASGDPMTVAKAKFQKICVRSTRSSALDHKRCRCLTNAVEQRVYIPMEFELAGVMTKAILTNRKFMAKTRLKSRLKKIWKNYEGKITLHRANAIWNTVRYSGINCARSVQ